MPASAPVADPNALHDHAVQAEKHLEQLATGLSQVGGDPAAIKTVSGMADACRKLAVALAGAARQAPPPQPTMASATNDMMAQHQAARQAQLPPQ